MQRCIPNLRSEYLISLLKNLNWKTFSNLKLESVAPNTGSMVPIGSEAILLIHKSYTFELKFTQLNLRMVVNKMDVTQGFLFYYFFIMI